MRERSFEEEEELERLWVCQSANRTVSLNVSPEEHALYPGL